MDTAPVRNAEIAASFRETADLLELEDANPYRVRSYREAADTLDELDRPVADLVAAGEDLTELPAIGAALAGRIERMVATGRLDILETLRQQREPILNLLLEIPGIGPKRAQLLRDELGVATEEELETATRIGRVRALPGFGARMQTAILDHLARTRPRAGRRQPWSAGSRAVAPPLSS